MRRVIFGVLVLCLGSSVTAADIPRPEHPTPDAVRKHWSNLNGNWQFRLDPKDEGLKAGWEKPDSPEFDKTIVVPFPWESELSGIKQPDYHGVAWYRRTFEVPKDFPKDHRVLLHFGAVDWRADVWVNGIHVADHEGGYSPFFVSIDEALKTSEGKPATLVVRVFDPTDPAQPTGKQVGWYTTTSGIWQTVWLEAVPEARIAHWQVRTEIDPASAQFRVMPSGLKPGKYQFIVKSSDPGVNRVEVEVNQGDKPELITINVPVKDAKLWTPETPKLYDVTLELKSPEGTIDSVQTYFGLRTIKRGKFGDSPYERILLNGKPVYLRTALDQSFNPKGIYTAPDDEFLKRDLILAKLNGLNGLRIHIKPDEPRRLYWADKIGLLILEDMPNTWRQNAEARTAWQKTMDETIARDQNHPSIITWVAFNETWGLGSPEDYKKDKDTQEWVGRMVDRIRKLDPTRLVEDNSPCNYDHVENTDLNSWHFYIDNHAEAKRHITEVVDKTEPGNGFNYCPGRSQGTAPLINSEYGGVSAGGGDRDVSWCFRDLTTLLRRQPKIQGYVYTELSDIEWEHNGFVNYDRSLKDFGYDTWLPDMRPNELNGADFIGFDAPPAIVVKPGEKVSVPLFVSHFSELKGPPQLRWWVSGWDDNGDWINAVAPATRPVEWSRYDVKTLEPLTFEAPKRPFVGSVSLVLRDENNVRIAANFVNLVVKPETPLPRVQRLDDNQAVLRFEPGDFSRRRWTEGSGGPKGKVHGRGKGYYEYQLKLPESIVKARPVSFDLRFEMASKAGREKVEWPSRISSQDYPQTDEHKWPTTVAILLNGTQVQRQELDDDPADARGVLSHLAGVEHGSYGELVEASGQIPESAVKAITGGKPLVLRLEVPEDAPHIGGLSLFGAETGQFPFDPTVTIHTERELPVDLGVKPGESIAIDRFSDRRSTLLNTGEDSPTEWSYTTDNPGPHWSEVAFEASTWKRGKGGFGTATTPGIRVNTRWDRPRIWLRTALEIPTIGPEDVLTLRIFHDEDAVIFVNGKPLLETKGFISGYQDIELTAAQASLFHSGKNSLAVQCRQTRGGQGIDVGLRLERTPR